MLIICCLQQRHREIYKNHFNKTAETNEKYEILIFSKNPDAGPRNFLRSHALDYACEIAKGADGDSAIIHVLPERTLLHNKDFLSLAEPDYKDEKAAGRNLFVRQNLKDREL